MAVMWIVVLVFCFSPAFCADTVTTTESPDHHACSLPCHPRGEGGCQQCTDMTFECRRAGLTGICSSYFNNNSTNMTHVFLEDNQLSDFSSFPTTTSRVMELDISRNNFTKIMRVDLARFTALKVLKICGNKLGSLPNDLLQNLEQLRTIHMNKINLGSLPADIFKSNKILDHVELSDNKMTEFPAESFKEGNIITFLDIQKNPIKVFKDTDFTRLRKLRYLNLGSLEITTIRSFTFSPMLNLERIVLDSNDKLNFIEEDAFGWSTKDPKTMVQKLESFSIFGCHFGSLDRHVVNWKGLTEVNFKKNPWDCDCTIEWMLDPNTWSKDVWETTALPMLKLTECFDSPIPIFRNWKLGELTWKQLNDTCPSGNRPRLDEQQRSRTSIIVTILVITLLVSCIAVVLGVLMYRRCHRQMPIPQAVNPYRAIYNQGAVQSYEEGLEKEQKSPYEL